MTDPTSNLNTVQADKFFVWDPVSKAHVNLQSSIVGLAPSTLNTLQALASSVGNDPSFSTNLAATTSALQASINKEAEASDVTAGLNLKAPLASPAFTGTIKSFEVDGGSG